MTRKLKIGVIGAGVFGGYHASKCMAHPRAEFIGVHDHDPKRMGSLVQKYGGQPFKTSQVLLRQADAVVIATPASAHAPMALSALRAGCHVLIEKPIAHDLKSAQAIVDLAKRKNLIVQVGHQERFVVSAIGLDKVTETPIKISGHRRSPFSPRGTDVSVTLDLMTHDIDLAIWLMGQDPLKVRGQSMIISSDHPDTAYAILEFPNGQAHLEASRVEDKSSRLLSLIYPSGTVEIDFNAKSLMHNTPFDLNADFANDPKAKDSLGAATHAFIEAILDGKPVPVTGGHGLRALRAALEVDQY